MKTVILTNLPGRPRETKTAWFRSITKAFEGLRLFDAVTTADNNGAITIWKRHTKGGTKLVYECVRQRYCVAQCNGQFYTLKEVRAWLKVQFPKI